MNKKIDLSKEIDGLKYSSPKSRTEQELIAFKISGSELKTLRRVAKQHDINISGFTKNLLIA
jgi:hypothetical protein